MMEYKGYIARVEIDDDVGILHGEVINTRDVITLEGTSIDELRQALADSLKTISHFAPNGVKSRISLSPASSVCV